MEGVETYFKNCIKGVTLHNSQVREERRGSEGLFKRDRRYSERWCRNKRSSNILFQREREQTAVGRRRET